MKLNEFYSFTFALLIILLHYTRLLRVFMFAAAGKEKPDA